MRKKTIVVVVNMAKIIQLCCINILCPDVVKFVSECCWINLLKLVKVNLKQHMKAPQYAFQNITKSYSSERFRLHQALVNNWIWQFEPPIFFNVRIFMIIPGYEFVSKIKNNIIFGIKWNMKFITNVLRQNVPVRQKSYNSIFIKKICNFL
jgi:hypothetical protein